MKSYNFPIVIEKDDDGYFVSCPLFQGCFSQGDTCEEAISNIEDAVRLHMEERLIRDETVYEPQQISVSMLRFAME
ncbi:MAG: type II toxin-antitoxin system HicB family antitoxin [Patescibacteria group bacterium]